jgi:hypothetical protein
MVYRRPKPHSEGEDAGKWIINGKVYDLGPFMGRHPGGQYILEVSQGRDCTAIFHSYHAVSTKPITKMMEKFYVRDATSDEQVDSKIWEWDSMPFYDELQREVHTVLGGSRAATKASIAHLLQYAVATVGLVVSMRAWLGGSTLAGVVMGHCIWLCCVDVIHAATHYAVFVNPELNVVVGWLFGWFHHVPAMWMRQHVLGHHPYTNVPGLDPDLEHFTQFEEVGGGWRLSGILKPVVVNHWRRSLLPIASIAGIGPLVGETLQVRGGAAPTAPGPPPGLAPRRAWSERAVEGRGHASLLTNIAPPAGPGRRRVHEVHPPEACAGGSRPDAAAHVDLRLPRHRAPALGQPLAPPRLAPLGRASPLPLPETFGSPPARPPAPAPADRDCAWPGARGDLLHVLERLARQREVRELGQGRRRGYNRRR